MLTCPNTHKRNCGSPFSPSKRAWHLSFLTHPPQRRTMDTHTTPRDDIFAIIPDLDDFELLIPEWRGKSGEG
jgi:hypothetical protein